MTNETTQISDRELEILRLVATGATNQQIASQLNISINTVKVHLRNIFSKIGVASRTEATMYAVRMGLVHTGEPALAPVPVAAVATEVPAEAGGALDPARPAPDWLSAPAERELPAVSQLVAVEPAPLLPAVDHAPIPQAAPTVRSRSWRLPVAGAVLLALVSIGLYWFFTRSDATGQPAATASAVPTAGVAVPGARERWRELAPLPAERSGFALASYIYEGKRYLYAIGGDVGGQASDQVLRYDLAENTWVPLSAKPTAVADVQSGVIGGKLYVPGGRLASGQISDAFEAYDPQNDRWSALARLPQPRSGYALAVVEGKLYLFGGWDGQNYHNEVWEYDLGKNEWSPRKPMPTARAFAAATVVENAAYIAGGVNEQGSLAVHERYIPAEDNGAGNPWAVKAKLPSATDHMAIAAISDQVFVVGGAQGASQLLIYTVGTDSWRTDKLPIVAASDLRAQAIGNKLYLVGGRGASAANTQVYEYQAIYSVLLPAVVN